MASVHDQLYGGPGTDYIDSGLGDDSLDGGSGKVESIEGSPNDDISAATASTPFTAKAGRTASTPATAAATEQSHPITSQIEGELRELRVRALQSGWS